MNSLKIEITKGEHMDFGKESGDLNPIHYDDRLGSTLGCEGRVIFGGLLIQKIFNVLNFQENNYEIVNFDLRFNLGASLCSEINLLFENDKSGYISLELEQFNKTIAKGICNYKIVERLKENYIDNLINDLRKCSENVASWHGYDKGCAVIGRWSFYDPKNNPSSFLKENSNVEKIDPRFDIYSYKAVLNLNHEVEFRFFDGLNSWITEETDEDCITPDNNARRALIIGGTGTLGLGIKQNLIKRNYKVFSSSRYSGGDYILNLIEESSSDQMYRILKEIKPQLVSFCAIDKIDANTKMNLIFKNFKKSIEMFAEEGETFSIFYPSSYYVDASDIASSKGLEKYAQNKLNQEKELEELIKNYSNISVLIYRLKEFNSRQHALSQENKPNDIDTNLVNEIIYKLDNSGDIDEGRRYKIVTC